MKSVATRPISIRTSSISLVILFLIQFLNSSGTKSNLYSFENTPSPGIFYGKESFKPDSCTVLFQSMGGTGIKALKIKTGSLISEPDDPSLDGFYCDAWYTDPDYTTKWDFSSDTVVSNIMLFAHWMKEDFSEVSPDGKYLDEKKYFFQTPLNYHENFNSTRRYPLIIGLHGGRGGEGWFYAPFLYDNPEQSMNHPAFLFSPTSLKGWGDGARWARQEIRRIVNNYRIDTCRIYIVGFSAGGSGSFPFAEKLYLEQGLISAAIFRSAGQSKANFTIPALQENTSVWYEVGSLDEPVRIEMADSAYQQMFNRFEDDEIKEGFEKLTIEGIPVETMIISVNGVEHMRKSILLGIGHEPFLCYKDSSVIEWLFTQSICRK